MGAGIAEENGGRQNLTVDVKPGQIFLFRKVSSPSPAIHLNINPIQLDPKPQSQKLGLHLPAGDECNALIIIVSILNIQMNLQNCIAGLLHFNANKMCKPLVSRAAGERFCPETNTHLL